MTLLLPVVACQPGSVAEEPVHLIPTGEIRCVACGTLKFLPTTKYTVERDLWQFFASREGFAMIDLADGAMIKPYYTCVKEHPIEQ